jgi:hypothetical protein
MQEYKLLGAAALVSATVSILAGAAAAQDICKGFGPQAPRDISRTEGANKTVFNLAPSATQMNLCNIHTHTNAEHKGPGFSMSAGDGEHGGYKCNDTDTLTAAELEDPAAGHGAFHGVKPGDTIEVHWVYTTCDVDPGEGLGSCLSEQCANPQLRVEAQVFLVVNDPDAPSIDDFDYDGNVVNGLDQPEALPVDTGDPIVFVGSTTGPSYTQEVCSPMQVTWSVRPQCMKIDVNSLHEWAEHGNAFNEDHSHGVRQLVTAPELLAPMN